MVLFAFLKKVGGVFTKSWYTKLGNKNPSKEEKRNMTGVKKSIALILCLVLMLGMVPNLPVRAEETGWSRGLNGAMGWNESSYYSVEKKTSNNNWRQGLASANGEIAFLESGDPNEDVFIFNNTKIVYDDNSLHVVPYLADIIDDQRAGSINYNRWVWNQAANRYDEQTFGVNGGRGMAWSRPYQPAAQYRIKNNDYSAANKNEYNRYTNYETAEVGAQWKDANGNEWNRRSFASRADDVIVTYIEAPKGKNLNITISMDHITDMRNEGTLDTLPDTDYVVSKEGNEVVGFGTVGKYVTRNITGSKNQEKTLFSYGGWASATHIVLGDGGNVAYQAAKRTIATNNGFAVKQAFEANDPKLTITGTNSVMLITKVDRQDKDCNSVGDIRTKLYDRLQNEINVLIDERGVKSNEAGYQALLEPHAKLHGAMFNNVRLELCQTEEEKADRKLTNQQLIQKQNGNKNQINKAFLERVYNNGRYGLICANGYGTTRLSAIWCGTWNPSWSGDYTLDANTNLQVSGLNTGNMADAGQGYINFIVRMVADWETNAAQIYGMTDAILGPPRVDGTGQGQSYHYSDTYPHVFVNGITDWLLLPMFEYWQCYGNRKIEVGKDIDLERNMSVLDWTAEDVARIRSDGYYDYEEDVLFPLIMKAMNFWIQFADEKYYTDGNGLRHVNDGTTLSQAVAAGDENARYIFAPGFSPENSPGKGGESVQALAYNVTMDIAACHDCLFMARTLLEKKNPNDTRLAQWAEFEKRIPEYLYEKKTGELKEWASYDLAEAHNHRHESHAYAAWPGYEAQDNEAIREGVAIAMDMRAAAYGGQEASESHGATHKALVEARLKRPVSLERVMLYLLTNGYQYTNMLTSHNRNNSSCLCTDSAFGLMGAVNESLLYSNTGIVEILPTLLPNMDKGKITGLRARTNTQVDILWDRDALSASVTLAADEDISELKVMCGIDWNDAFINGVKQRVGQDNEGRRFISVALHKNQTVQVDFKLSSDDGSVRKAYGEILAGEFDDSNHNIIPNKDGSVGETASFDTLIYKGMDFGINGSRTYMTLTAANNRTTGGLNRDGSSVVRIYTADPAEGNPAFSEIVIPTTGGKFQSFKVPLPSKLFGKQDIYIKSQDGGLTIQSFEFSEMLMANVSNGEKVSISEQKPFELELNTDIYRYTLNGASVQNGYIITQPGDYVLKATTIADGKEFTISFNTYVSKANQLLKKDITVVSGESIQLDENAKDDTLKLWLIPQESDTFTEGVFGTCSSGNTDSLKVPVAEGKYQLVVVDANGQIIGRSDALVKVRRAGSAHVEVNFSDSASETDYEVINPSATKILEGRGLYMVTTKDGFEPANDQLSGNAATTPKDLILIPVSGDWEATLKFDFSTGNASNGYYQFFGFYAMEDYNNAAGIRGGDGAMQDFLRKDGSITAETKNSTPGLSSNGTYWYRIIKEDTTYTCLRSEDGETFNEMFSYNNTGIEAEHLAIDAYTGMTEGYEFILKTLQVEGSSGPADCAHSYTEIKQEPSCTENGYVTRVCVKCGAVEPGEELVAEGHDFHNGVCRRCGMTDPDYKAHCEGGEDCPSRKFTDAPKPDNWAHAGIDYCIENNLMNGMSDTIFSPNGTVTRAQLVTILYRVANEPEVVSSGTFTDVPNGMWYSNSIEWAAANNIVNGVSKNRFNPMGNITREQIATILYRYAGNPAVSGNLSAFPDKDMVHDYAIDALIWATEEELINGIKSNDVTKLAPQSNATRAQIAAIIMRFIEK